MYFTMAVKMNLQQKQPLTASIAEAIDYCMANDVLKDFLQEKQKEVYDMVSVEWNMDKAKEVWLEEGIEKGIAKGIEKGIAKGIEKGIEKGRECIINCVSKTSAV